MHFTSSILYICSFCWLLLSSSFCILFSYHHRGEHGLSPFHHMTLYAMLSSSWNWCAFSCNKALSEMYDCIGCLVWGGRWGWWVVGGWGGVGIFPAYHTWLRILPLRFSGIDPPPPFICFLSLGLSSPAPALFLSYFLATVMHAMLCNPPPPG